jgi:hypothetical protein
MLDDQVRADGWTACERRSRWQRGRRRRLMAAWVGESIPVSRQGAGSTSASCTSADDKETASRWTRREGLCPPRMRRMK